MSLAEDAHMGPRFESTEAFLAWVELQPEWWELWDGVAVQMPPMMDGALNHSRISGNALRGLAAGLGAGPHEAFGVGVAVVLGPGRVAFPDACVGCEPEAQAALARPVVIVEVLSPATTARGLGDKATAYRRLPSLRHLVFVRQDRIGVQHFHRDAAGQEFALTEIDRVDGALRLTAVGVEVGVAELYARVAFSG